MFRNLVYGMMLLVLTALSTATNGGENISLDGFPPVVVSTFPKSGDVNVDPSIGEIRVTFSKDMTTENMWSWVIHAKKLFPVIAGEVKYLADNRTNVAPVKLEPNSTYAIWFNSPDYRHNAFRDRFNNPAVPYLLVFRTGD